MRDVVPLVGSDEEIARVATSAGEAVRGARHEGWFRRLGEMARLRETAMREANVREAGRSAVPLKADDASGSRWVPWWWTFLIIGCAAALTSAAIVLPPKFSGQDTASMMAVAVPAGIVAVVVLGLLALVPIPQAIRGRVVVNGVAALCCAAVVVIPAFALNLFRIDLFVETGEEGALMSWFIATGATLLAAISLVIRLRSRRLTRGSDKRTSRDPGTRAVALARQLANSVPEDARSARSIAWADSVGAQGMPETVTQQARSLGPYAYLVWAHYNGEIPLSRPESLVADSRQ